MGGAVSQRPELLRDLFKILTPRLKDWGRGWCWGWQGPAPSRGRRPPSRRARGPGPDALAELGGGCCTGSPPLGPRRLARACPEAPWLPLRLPPAGLAGRGRGGSEVMGAGHPEGGGESLVWPGNSPGLGGGSEDFGSSAKSGDCHGEKSWVRAPPQTAETTHVSLGGEAPCPRNGASPRKTRQGLLEGQAGGTGGETGAAGRGGPHRPGGPGTCMS